MAVSTPQLPLVGLSRPGFEHAVFDRWGLCTSFNSDSLTSTHGIGSEDWSKAAELPVWDLLGEGYLLTTLQGISGVSKTWTAPGIGHEAELLDQPWLLCLHLRVSVFGFLPSSCGDVWLKCITPEASSSQIRIRRIHECQHYLLKSCRKATKYKVSKLLCKSDPGIPDVM